MTLPTRLLRGERLYLFRMTGLALHDRRSHVEISKSAVALETLHVVEAVIGFEPLLVDVRGNILMTLGTGYQSFLTGQLGMFVWFRDTGCFGLI